MSRTSRNRGNAHQRYIAKRLNGRNVGILGQEDVMLENGNFSIECKERVGFAGKKFMEQSIKNARGKIPIVIVHVLNEKHDDDLVLIRLIDFEGLIK